MGAFVFMLLSLYSYVVKLSELNRNFISYCVKNRIGKTSFSVKIIYFITNILGRFEAYKNTNDFDKRGHYVPKLLLRRFRLSEDGPLKGKIYQYNFLLNSITEEPINNVAQIKDFYVFKQKGGGHSDYVEKQIYGNFIESFGSQVIKRINQLDEDPELTIFEQNVLSTFISHQITRTPIFYFQIRKYVLFLYEKNLLKLDDLGDKKFIEEVIVKNKHNLTYDDLVNFVPKHTVKGDVNHLGHISRLIAGSIMEDVFRHNFYFLTIPAESSEEFVISDNPVVRVDFKKYEVKRYFDWWTKRSDDIWIFMPISPKKCIYLTTKKKIDGVIEVDDGDIATTVNFGQYLNAMNFVYSRKDSLIKVHMKKYLRELLKYKQVVANPEDILK